MTTMTTTLNIIDINMRLKEIMREYRFKFGLDGAHDPELNQAERVSARIDNFERVQPEIAQKALTELEIALIA